VEPTLTIVGASARAAAQSAVRAGFRVRAGDLFGDVDLARIALSSRVERYPAGLAAVVSGPQPGAWMYCGALENHPRLVVAMARTRPLWGNDGEVLARARDPLRVAAALAAAGHQHPLVETSSARVPTTGRWLAKPRKSAGGAKIGFWDPAQTRGTPPGGLYFQQFIAGEAYSALYVGAQRESVLVGVTRQLVGESWTGAGAFRYCGSIGPVKPGHDAIESFEKIGRTFARAFRLTGLFGVDVIINGRGVWPLEVNPRYTASAEILERACGESLIAWHVAACREGSLPTPPRGSSRLWGKAIWFSGARMVVSPQMVEMALADADHMADIPRAGSVVEAGWPVMTLLAEGSHENEVLDRLRHRIEGLLAQFAVRVAEPA
jgi:predicted ATP-grasp superfamily ATP-dependent carboligase